MLLYEPKGGTQSKLPVWCTILQLRLSIQKPSNVGCHKVSSLLRICLELVKPQIALRRWLPLKRLTKFSLALGSTCLRAGCKSACKGCSMNHWTGINGERVSHTPSFTGFSGSWLTSTNCLMMSCAPQSWRSFANGQMRCAHVRSWVYLMYISYIWCDCQDDRIRKMKSYGPISWSNDIVETNFLKQFYEWVPVQKILRGAQHLAAKQTDISSHQAVPSGGMYIEKATAEN